MKKILINPFVKLIECIFLFVLKIVNNQGISLIVLSLFITIILLPFYFFAEKIAEKEKEIQSKMKPKIDELKSVYKGYELHLYIKNVYRLNNYHPIYSLRSLLSLLIQIPFFIGAYQFLSSYAGFDGFAFLGIINLAEPDKIIRLGTISINLLPILMTFFNLVSGYVYSFNSNRSEKITIIIVAIIFLLLLYNSPASLLIYWTFNNIFSLIKNIIFLSVQNKLRSEKNV